MGMLGRSQKDGKKFVNPTPTLVGGPGLAFKALARYAVNRAERVPKVAPGPFHTDAKIYATAPPSGLRLTWMGHSSSLLEIDGVRVLIDPVWDERASPLQWMGPKRFFPPPLPLEDLPEIEVVLISHDHYDHLGEGTVRGLASLPATAQATWVTSVGVAPLLRKFGLGADQTVVEMQWMDQATVKGLLLTALPARHFSGRSLSNRFETLWSSFVLQGDQHKVYYGADSGWWKGYAEIGSAYGPFDLTMLEIGAYDDLWKDIHLGPDEAARAFLDLDAGGLLMPVHWGLFDLALHAWRQPIERLVEVAKHKGIGLWVPEPGQPTELLRGQSLLSDWWRAGSRFSPGG